MPAKIGPRPKPDRDAQRAKAVDLLAGLRTDAADLTGALAALPTSGRTAAQRRDALILRALLRLVRWTIISSGAATAADLGPDPS